MRIFFLARIFSTAVLAMITGMGCWEEPQFEVETHEVEVKELESEITELEKIELSGIIINADFNIDSLSGMTIEDIERHPECSLSDYKPHGTSAGEEPIRIRGTEETVGWALIDNNATVVRVRHKESQEE